MKAMPRNLRSEHTPLQFSEMGFFLAGIRSYPIGKNYIPLGVLHCVSSLLAPTISSSVHSSSITVKVNRFHHEMQQQAIEGLGFMDNGFGVQRMHVARNLVGFRNFPKNLRHYSSSPADCREGSSDGFTAEDIVARGWQILEESESDWRSHAAVIAQSIQLIKKRLQWKKVLFRLEQLNAELTRSDLWDDPIRAGQLSREHGLLSGKVKAIKDLEAELIEHVDLLELAREEKDSELEEETTRALLNMRKIAKEKELAALLAGEHDSCSCYLEIQSGAGGTESMDWAAMVMRMYKLWAQRRGFKVTTVDEMAGEVAGIKRATMRLDGDFAFGYAKAEVGVHRLVRISPFDSGKRRHTSFAAVAVIPILNDASLQYQINEADLRIERFRSGGPGGQHANTTDSAVRIVHIPTGITAVCQNERSQHRNKDMAMAVLQSRLDQLEMARQAQSNAQHTQSLSEITWGNQIRSYVLHPYRMVKDLRTNYEVSDPDSVLEGDLDGFIFSFLSSAVDKDGEQ